MNLNIVTIIMLAALFAVLLYMVVQKAVVSAFKEIQLLNDREGRETEVSETLRLCLEKECHLALAKEVRFGSGFLKEVEGKVLSVDSTWVGIMYEGEDNQAAMNLVRIAFIDSVTVNMGNRL